MELMTEHNLFGDPITSKPIIQREEFADILFLMLKDISLEDFIGNITTKFLETMEYIKLLNGERACQKTSLLFNPHRMDIQIGASKTGIYKAFKDRGFISGLARAILFKEDKNLKDLLYQVLQLGINGIQYANEFPPHIMRDICKEYNLTRDSKILDPCAGWGGRMIGASVITDHYHCFEPSTLTHQGLEKLAEFIKIIRPNFDAMIECVPFEESVLTGKYDFALTSPPYYDTEKYSNEETNSFNRYRTFKDWTDGFYIPMIAKAMDALNGGSCFILNIGSRIYPLNKILMDNFSEQYKITKLGNYLSGTAGLGKSGEGEMFYEIKKVSHCA